MRWYLIALWLLTASFFWEDEEKEIKALHQTAEAAFRDDDFSSAKEAYHTLLKRVDVKGMRKNLIDWSAYVDMVMRYAEACASLEECDEAVHALSKLLSKSPPESLIPRIKLFRARLMSQKSGPQKAFLDMQNVIEALPGHQWSCDELSFYHALCYSLDATYDDLLHKAKRLSVTGFHEEAMQIYEEVLKAIQAGVFPKARHNTMLEKKLRYLLVETHYSLKNYEKSLSYISKLDKENTLDREIIYLSALCHKERAEYEKALHSFIDYTQLGGEHYDEALFEIGYHYYRVGNRQDARCYFEDLQKPKGKKPKPQVLAAIYLARMDLEEKRYGNIEALLSPLISLLPAKDNLLYELWYLRGEAAYALEDFAFACECFQRAIPDWGRGAWRLQALYKLGWCYLRLEEYENAEGIFLRLLPTEESEIATLALGRLYLLQNDVTKMRELFKDKSFSLNGKHEALLLLAEGEGVYEEREKMYFEACSEAYQSCPTYPKAWYQRGINHFEEGLAGRDEAFQLATMAFEKAFFYYKDIDSKAAARILKLEAKADFYRNSPTTSLAYLEALLEQYNESADEKEETLYLKGMIASSLLDSAQAKESLGQVIKLYPRGRYVADAFFWLGSLLFQEREYEKAEKLFLNLSQNYPESSFAGDGWYWAALCSEKLDGDPVRIMRLRKQVYERYPTSQYAPEAYFQQFSYQEYLEGNSHALQHLMLFPERFPRSPFIVAAYYLLGSHSNSYEEGVLRFKAAIRSFHANSFLDPSAIFFLYQSRLALALLHMPRDLYKGKVVLEILLEEFENPNHPLISKLQDAHAFFEEALFSYAQCHIALQEKGKAVECLTRLLDHYKKLGVKEGFYLASAWRENGKLAMECEDYITALTCFDIAHECGQHVFSSEQTFDLLLLKSDCYRARKEYDLSMKLLSNIINADVGSPLRLKAMLLRADLYELQERPELAMRQLESLAKLEGEWSLMARQKLRERYGLE